MKKDKEDSLHFSDNVEIEFRDYPEPKNSQKKNVSKIFEAALDAVEAMDKKSH